MKEITKEKSSCLSIVFKLNTNLYALKVNIISSILLLEEKNIAKIPNTSAKIRGIMNLRGNIIAIVDLRCVFGITSLQKEYSTFKNMLDARIQDHLTWVEELNCSVKEGRKFKLTTDPHKCKLGIWYDNFTTDLDSINHHMKKIDEPHRKLHQAALNVQNCQRNCESCTRKECLENILKKVEDEYVPHVVCLLEQAKDIFISNFRETIIVLDIGEQQIGIIVDEVVGIEHLKLLRKNNRSEKNSKNYILNTAQSKDLDKVVQIINDKKLLTHLEILS